MKKFMRLFYLHEFLGSLDFSRGLFVVYLIAKGFSLTQVGILQTLLFWSNLAFEVPAGLLADKTKRKYSIAIGLIVTAIAACVMMLATNIYIAALSFILFGMGFAFRSGADHALLFDELKTAGGSLSDKFVEFSAKSRSLVNIALVLAMILGGVLQSFGWNYVYSAFVVSSLLAAICILSIQETSIIKTEIETDDNNVSVFENLKSFLNKKEGRSLLFFIIGMGFLEATHAPFFIYMQAYLKQNGLSESYVSIVIALSLGLTSLGYSFVDKLKHITFPRLVLVCNLFLAFLISLYFLAPPIAVAISLFAVIDMVPSLLFVHSDNYINEQIPSHIRASLLSVHSFVGSVFISFAFLFGGRMLDVFPAHIVLASIGVLPLLGFVFLSIHFRNQMVKTEAECL